MRLGRTLHVLDIKKIRFGKSGEKIDASYWNPEELDCFMRQEDNTQSVKKMPKEETLRYH